ncbi:MAG: DinB family protein [Bacteroidetes bacterium]|nr:DinB family protein [Bacteroidota bacterium]
MFPEVDEQSLLSGEPIEVVGAFLSHSRQMGDWFVSNASWLESLQVPDGKWNGIQTLSHLIFWENWCREHRFGAIIKKLKTLVPSGSDQVNPASVTAFTGNIRQLTRQLEKARNQTINELGQTEDEAWDWKSRHPDEGPVDLYRMVTMMARHDRTHVLSLLKYRI